MERKSRFYEYHADDRFRSLRRSQVNFRMLGHDFANDTSLYDIRRISQARGCSKRCFRWLAMLFLISCVIFCVLRFVTKYKYPISMEVTMNTHLDFPAVTVCNMNPYKLSVVQSHPNISPLLPESSWKIQTEKSQLDCTSTEEYDYEEECCDCDVTYFTMPPPVADDSFTDSNQAKGKYTWDGNNLTETIHDMVALMTEKEKRALGYQAQEFILDCHVEGLPCYAERDFDHFFHSTYGNCYVFNSGWNNTRTALSVHQTGRLHGLHLTLNIGQEDYIVGIGDQAGARVLVHPSGMVPQLAEQGMLASPGELTSIGVAKQVKQKHPASGCIDPGFPATQKDIIAEAFGVNYTKWGCLNSCLRQAVISICGCSDIESGLGASHHLSPVCLRNDTNQADCKRQVVQEFHAGDLGCEDQCPDPCVEHGFKQRVSQIQSQRSQAKAILLNSVHRNMSDIDDGDAYILANFLSIEVYYKDFNVESIQETETYLAVDVLGLLPFVLGLSASYIFIDLLELLMDMTVMLCIKHKLHTTASNSNIDPSTIPTNDGTSNDKQKAGASGHIKVLESERTPSLI